MEPRVSKRDRKLNLSYELPHRLHCSCIYPVRAPNGSTVIIYGHERGLRFLWRGGRRHKAQPAVPPAPLPANGLPKEADVIVIDDSDEEVQPISNLPSEPQEQYEEEEDEQDPNCPYPNIIEDLDIDCGGSVLHLAVPSIASSAAHLVPQVARKYIILAAACADGRIMLLSIPLAPPKPGQKDDPGLSEVVAEPLQKSGRIASCLDVKIVSSGDVESSASETGCHLLVAAASKSLNLWSTSTETRAGSLVGFHAPKCKTIHLPSPAAHLSFHPSSRSTQLLLQHGSGAVRLYKTILNRSTAGVEFTGEWMMTYHVPFHSSKDVLPARRKKILDTAWSLGGRGILVLLEDGEWGMWDLANPTQAGKNVEDFIFHGFLGSSGAAEVADAGKQRKSAAKLAPMTPNTRKAKADNLFREPPSASGMTFRGGISIATGVAKAGQTDESVMMWYGRDVYSITSMQAFWQRSTTGSSGFGSLYAPGLTQISDVNLMNEDITSICQLPQATSYSNLGPVKMQRDFLIFAEHRLIIQQHLRPSAPTSEALRQATAERPRSRDQPMLDAGELDLGGMDRMLDGMGDGRTRRVGFTH